MKPIQQLEPLRAYCQTLSEVTERVSHGDPAFFVAKKCFVMVMDSCFLLKSNMRLVARTLFL